ncbi:hypothetical protein [Zavarzinia sp. CC-PAN008]|uniref:hypothetical protein n=1 Tax=Zavarzinia sp. CC-PAN008 TaxID=3243332 RepID=UPI003F748660
MADPATDWLARVREVANGNSRFNQAARWLDMKMVVRFGDRPFWFKLYRGQIIDAMEYSPVTNMLGYDVIVSGTATDWAAIVAGRSRFDRAATTGVIAHDGNRTECEKSYKAQMVLGAEVFPACGLPPGMEGAR